MLIKLIRANGLDQILDGTFDLIVLALEFLRLLSDPFLLHLDELIKSEGLGILWKVDEDSLRKTLEVVLNTVLHDVVDVDDELLKLGESLMNVMKVAINVHGSPGEGDHTWSQLVLKILKMWHKKRFCVWSDLIDNSVILTKHKLELIVVHFELVFLKKDNFGAFWNLNTNSRQALGLSDECENFRVKVDVQFVVLWVTDYESGLKSSFGLLNFLSPFLPPEVLEGEKSVSNLVVHFDELFGLLLLDQVLWELLHWSRNSMEEMTRPSNAT